MWSVTVRHIGFCHRGAEEVLVVYPSETGSCHWGVYARRSVDQTDFADERKAFGLSAAHIDDSPDGQEDQYQREQM